MLDFESRLAHVERENAKLKTLLLRQRRAMNLLGVLLVSTLLVGGLLGATNLAPEDKEFGTVIAKKLIVTDAAGRERIRLETGNGKDAPESKVVLISSDGIEACNLEVHPGFSLITTRRFAGDTPGSYIWVDKDSATVTATGGGGTIPIQMYATKDTHAFIVNTNTGPVHEARLSIAKGFPQLAFADKAGRKILLDLDKDGKPNLRIQEVPIPLTYAPSGAAPQFEIKDGKIRKK